MQTLSFQLFATQSKRQTDISEEKQVGLYSSCSQAKIYNPAYEWLNSETLKSTLRQMSSLRFNIIKCNFPSLIFNVHSDCVFLKSLRQPSTVENSSSSSYIMRKFSYKQMRMASFRGKGWCHWKEAGWTTCFWKRNGLPKYKECLITNCIISS